MTFRKGDNYLQKHDIWDGRKLSTKTWHLSREIIIYKNITFGMGDPWYLAWRGNYLQKTWHLAWEIITYKNMTFRKGDNYLQKHDIWDGRKLSTKTWHLSREIIIYKNITFGMGDPWYLAWRGNYLQKTWHLAWEIITYKNMTFSMGDNYLQKLDI